eukprot:8292405-Alexandrium_andersonii.AAC.1
MLPERPYSPRALVPARSRACTMTGQPRTPRSGTLRSGLASVLLNVRALVPAPRTPVQHAPAGRQCGVCALAPLGTCAMLPAW